jgi:hypothetical protein
MTAVTTEVPAPQVESPSTILTADAGAGDVRLEYVG